MAYIVNNKVFSDIAEAKNYLDQTGTSGTIFYSNPTMSADLYPVSTYTPKSAPTVKTNSLFEMPPGDDIGPTPNLEDADSIFQILFDTIIGEQGIPEGVPAEVIEALRGDFGPTTIPAELQEVAIEIAEAGGFKEWLAQQPTGDPGPVKGDAPRQAPIQPEPEPEPPEQVGINLEDFQTQFPDLDPSAYEDGMYTDPTTGTVYVINIPPDLTEPEEDETDIAEDDTTDAIDDGADDLPSDDPFGDVIVQDPVKGGSQMGTDPVEPPDFIEPEPEPTGPVKGDPVRQAPIDPERPWEYIGNGRFRHVSTGEIITDPNYDPNNDLYEVGGIYSRGDEESLDPDEPEPEPVDVVVGPPGQDGADGRDGVDGQDGADGRDGVDGQDGRDGIDGQDGRDGVDGVDGQDGADGRDGRDGVDGADGADGRDGADGAAGRDGKDAGMFKPFMTSIGYTPVQLQQLIAPPQKDYFRELDGLIGRSLFGKMIK